MGLDDAWLLAVIAAELAIHVIFFPTTRLLAQFSAMQMVYAGYALATLALNQIPSSKSQIPTTPNSQGPKVNPNSQRPTPLCRVLRLGVALGFAVGIYTWDLEVGSGWSLGFGAWDLSLARTARSALQHHLPVITERIRLAADRRRVEPRLVEDRLEIGAGVA